MQLARTIGKMKRDRAELVVLMLAALLMAGRSWLRENPQHDSIAPLSLDDPPGWATDTKLASQRDDLATCRQVLSDGAVDFAVLDPTGDGACRRINRNLAQAGLLTPGGAQMTCQNMLGYELLLRHEVQPLAETLLGRQVDRIKHMGIYNCRRIGGGDSGNWSEHATGNAIDIAAYRC